MKSLTNYIYEAIARLPENKKGIVVFDIDDTILKVQSADMRIYKTIPGKKEIALTTDMFAKDPDANDPSKKSWFDYRDFNDPKKVYHSIVTGMPIIKNLRIMDSYIDAGYDFCFLTARGCEETIKKALDDFIRVRDRQTGAISKLGSIFKKTLSCAVNDTFKKYPGKNDAEKKANVLKSLCKQYDRVIFVDDDHKNVMAARNLHLDNLRVIKAWEN